MNLLKAIHAAYGSRPFVNVAVILAALAAVLIGSPEAHADVVDDYVDANAWRVCAVLDKYPSVGGVEGIILEIIEEGLTPEAAGAALGQSVMGYCPEHIGVAQAFADKWAGGRQKGFVA